MADDGTKRPTIRALDNGPLLVADLGNLSRKDGGPLAVSPQMALCRCGGSASKPACDGTHARNGFTDGKSAERGVDEVKVYVGSQITIHDNRGVCAHRGYCTDELPSVWRGGGQDPPVDPDGASVEAIIHICEKCPSGALSYSLPSGPRVQAVAGREPAIAIAERHYDQDGGYDVSGTIPLETSRDDRPESTEHYVLCRCGGSRNKPFCDGQHWYVKFLDEG